MPDMLGEDEESAIVQLDAIEQPVRCRLYLTWVGLFIVFKFN